VYSAAFLPLGILIILGFLKKAPVWVWKLYALGFILCLLGWELWFTYGLVGGQAVDVRRPAELNTLIPQHINWLLNSLADAGICLSGLFWVWILSGRKSTIFDKWSWKEFLILAIFFLFQNLIVELYIYQGQLAAGYELSWAPMAPTGPWWNPVLFVIGGKSVHLHTQLPWFIMTPLFYWLALRIKK
ncbi:MAG: hypothetical protein ACI9FN_003818, partial [Saprospiraceae bacterium]